jgi:transposase
MARHASDLWFTAHLQQSLRSVATAETKSQRPDLLKPVSVSRAQRDRKFFNRIKQCRRVAARYDKLAANYLAFIKLASIRIWLRANEFTV